MIPLTAFLPYVEPWAPGAPVPLMVQVLRDVCIDFCRVTNAVQLVETQDVAKGNRDFYPPEADSQFAVSVLQVTFNERSLQPVSIDSIRSGGALSALDDTLPVPQGTPLSYYMLYPGADTFYLYPTPDEDGILTVRASMRPTTEAEDVDDVLFRYWHRAIAAGALAQLLAMPDQGFTNLRAAQDAARAYSVESGRAAAEARRGGLRAASFVQPRRFA